MADEQSRDLMNFLLKMPHPHESLKQIEMEYLLAVYPLHKDVVHIYRLPGLENSNVSFRGGF